MEARRLSDTPQAGPAQWLVKGGLLWVSALTATAHQETDTGVQMRDIYGQLQTILRAAGSGPHDVVKTVDFLLPSALPSYRATADVRRDYFNGRFPTSTGVVVEGLPQQGALVSVDVVAHVGDGHRRESTPTTERAKRLTFRAAVEKGDVLWLSGTTGRHFDPVAATEAYPTELAAQVQIVYERQLRALQELGYSYADVVKTVDYLTPAALATYRESAEARRHFFGDRFPVSTRVVVNRLLNPQALVETDMVAVRGKREVIDPGWDRYRDLAQVPGLLINDLLFMSGFGAVDPVSDGLVGPDDLAAQAERAYLAVVAVVEAAGGSLADVVKVVEYLTPAGAGESERLNAVRSQYLQDGGYALSQTVVQRLLRRDMLVEVEAVAVLG